MLQKFDMDTSYNLIINKIEVWLETLISMLPNIVLCIVLLVLFWMLSRLARTIAVKLSRKVTDNIALIKLIGTIVFLSIMGIGIFIALSVLKLDKAVTSLLAGAGVIGLALGFAFQDTATNFISGVFMAVRKPFRIEDVIETSDVLGVVKKMNLRNIIMHSFNGQLVIIPNKDVFQKKITNFSVLPYRRIVLNAGVAYNSDLEKVKNIAESAISELDFVLKSKDVMLHFNEFGGSSINFSLYFWVANNDQPGYLKAVSFGMMALKKAFDNNGVEIPFPIRTLDVNPKQFEEIFSKFK